MAHGLAAQAFSDTQGQDAKRCCVRGLHAGLQFLKQIVLKVFKRLNACRSGKKRGFGLPYHKCTPQIELEADNIACGFAISRNLLYITYGMHILHSLVTSCVRLRFWSPASLQDQGLKYRACSCKILGKLSKSLQSCCFLTRKKNRSFIFIRAGIY